jgi:hypothetical protein
VSHATKLSEQIRLQHQLDVSSTLCMASLHDKRPETVAAREKLERSIAEIRDQLAKLQKVRA